MIHLCTCVVVLHMVVVEIGVTLVDIILFCCTSFKYMYYNSTVYYKQYNITVYTIDSIIF